MQEVKIGLNKYGVNSRISESPLSFSSLVSRIYNYDEPVMPLIQWKSGGGHFVNIDGYDSGNKDYIRYMDPWDGQYYYMVYSSFRDNSKQTWYGQVYDFSKF